MNHVGQEIFNSTNELTSHQFVQDKFVQEFVAISLLKNKRLYKELYEICTMIGGTTNPQKIRTRSPILNKTLRKLQRPK